ncbi:MAG: hypothetical protein U0838_04795 [Chloroflexota bacterium]
MFYQGAMAGTPWWTPYRGYLHLAPRAIASLETLTPEPALVGSILALLVTVSVAAFMASDRLAAVAPERARWLAAVVFLALPASYELLGSPTYVQWYLAVYLVLGIVAEPARGRWAYIDGITALVAGVTSPIAIFVVPFYWRQPTHRRTGGILSIAALAQVLTLIIAPHDAALRVPARLPEILGLRRCTEPLVGANLLPAAGLVVTVLLIPLVAAALRELPWEVLAAGGLVLAASMATSLETSAELLNGYGAQRYFFVGGSLVAIGVVLGAFRRSVAGMAAPVLAVGLLADYRLAPHPGIGA